MRTSLIVSTGHKRALFRSAISFQLILTKEFLLDLHFKDFLSLLFPSIELMINLTTSRFDLYSNVDNFNSADIKIDILIIIASISILWHLFVLRCHDVLRRAIY